MQNRPDALSLLRQSLDANTGSQEPLHARLRRGLLDLMSRGAWTPGDKLPPERELAEAAGISLGTVQRTLNSLASDGVVVRRHGHGTFMSAASQSDQLLHFRFAGDGGNALLPVYAEAIDRTEVKPEPPWSAFIPDAHSFIRVRRRVAVADEFDCLSEFYIDAVRFSELLSMPYQQLHRVLIRNVLAERFNAPALSISQQIHASEFNEEVGDILKLPKRKRFGMILEVFSHTHHEAPLSYQRIYIPANVRRLALATRK